MSLVWPILLFATPLLIAALGELVVERAGVVNIGIEGMMLAGALGAWIGNTTFGFAFGLLSGIFAALLLAALFAATILLFQADQIVTGTGLNLLSLGLTGLIYQRLNASTTAHSITQISPALLASAFPLLALGIWSFLTFTRPGLELNAIGESPQAADSAGILVNRRKFYAVLFGGACAGLAGSYYSTLRVAGFTENTIAGDGFLALAIVIFGRWSAPGIVVAGLFFGLVRAIAERLNVSGAFPQSARYLFNTLPYAISLLALAGVAGRSRAPAALGRAYIRE